MMAADPSSVDYLMTRAQWLINLVGPEAAKVIVTAYVVLNHVAGLFLALVVICVVVWAVRSRKEDADDMPTYGDMNKGQWAVYGGHAMFKAAKVGAKGVGVAWEIIWQWTKRGRFRRPRMRF